MLGWLGVLYLAEFAVMSRFSARTVSAKKLQIFARVFMAFRIVGFRRRSRLDMEGTSVGEERAIEG